MKDRNAMSAAIALVVLIALAIIVTVIANRQNPPIEETITPQPNATPTQPLPPAATAGTVPVPFFTQTLIYGMEGNEQVAAMQSVLIQQGFLNGRPNGQMYTYTQDALKKFQEAMDIPVTGRVDKDTQKVLNALVPTLPIGSTILSCPGIAALAPAANTTVTLPLSVSGIIHPTENPGSWSVFEGQAGTVSIVSLSGDELAMPVPITLSVDWMNTNPKPFTATIPSLASTPSENLVFLKFRDDNAADLPEGVPHYCFIPITLAQ